MLRSAITDARDMARFDLENDPDVGPAVKQKVQEARAKEIQKRERLGSYLQ